MFERLKAIWNLPEKLESKEDRLKAYADMCQNCAEKAVEKRFEQHKSSIKGVLKAFSKSLNEIYETVHPDHAKIENFSSRIAELEKKVELLETKQSLVYFEGTGSPECDAEDIADLKKRVAALEKTQNNHITFRGRSLEYLVQRLELSGGADELLKGQRRYINRLLRLLRTVTEDPGKSITEDLRKAEKWNKILRKKVRVWKEKSEYNKNQKAVDER